MYSRSIYFNTTDLKGILNLFLLAVPLIVLMSACTQKTAQEKNLHNTLLNEYPDTFLRVQFIDNDKLHLEFELSDENSNRDTLRKKAREYAAYGYDSFNKSNQVTSVTVSLKGAGTGNMTTAAASESFIFAGEELKENE